MPHSRTMPTSYVWVGRVIRTFLFATTRPRWRGTENLDRPGGFIVAANHITTIDPLTTAHVLFDQGIGPKILAKAELFTIPWFGAILRSTGQIPVHRGSRQASESIAAAAAALAAGEVVLIFPEGTLTRDPDLWPMQGRTGVARLALMTGAPVIPLGQWGAQKLLPPRSGRFRPFPRAEVRVSVGEPVDLVDLGDRLDGDALSEATSRIMASITAHVALVRGEEPGQGPTDQGPTDRTPAEG